MCPSNPRDSFAANSGRLPTAVNPGGGRGRVVAAFGRQIDNHS